MSTDGRVIAGARTPDPRASWGWPPCAVNVWTSRAVAAVCASTSSGCAGKLPQPGWRHTTGMSEARRGKLLLKTAESRVDVAFQSIGHEEKSYSAEIAEVE